MPLIALWKKRSVALAMLAGCFIFLAMQIPSNELRALKAQAQRLKATLTIGKEGLSTQFLAALDLELNRHGLVKVKFDEFKEQKKELAPQVAEKSSSHLVTRVGNVVVLYRPRPEEEEKQG